MNDYCESHGYKSMGIAHAAQTVIHHLVYGQVSLAQRLFSADRGIDWYRVSARDWYIFCAILWFAFFFVYFITFVHRHDVLKYHMLLEFIWQCISSIFTIFEHSTCKSHYSGVHIIANFCNGTSITWVAKGINKNKKSPKII